MHWYYSSDSEWLIWHWWWSPLFFFIFISPSWAEWKEAAAWCSGALWRKELLLANEGSHKKTLLFGTKFQTCGATHPFRFGTRSPLNFKDLGLLPWICRKFIDFTISLGPPTYPYRSVFRCARPMVKWLSDSHFWDCSCNALSNLWICSWPDD